MVIPCLIPISTHYPFSQWLSSHTINHANTYNVFPLRRSVDNVDSCGLAKAISKDCEHDDGDPVGVVYVVRPHSPLRAHALVTLFSHSIY